MMLVSSRFLCFAAPVLGAICASAQNIVLTNDDGWATAMIRAQFSALEDAGYEVVLSAPAEDQSGTGSQSATPQPLGDDETCEFDSCPVGSPAEGSDPSDPRINYVNSFPVDAVRFGIQTLAPQLGGRPDLVVSGPNIGNNLAVLGGSGTIGAASEGTLEGIPSVAFSASSDSLDSVSFTTLTSDPDSTSSIAAGIYASLTTKFVDTLFASTARPILPAQISINVNYPSIDGCSSPDDFKFILTRVFPNLGQTDVETCGTDRLPWEVTTILRSGCFATVSVFNVGTKLDANAAAQGVVLEGLGASIWAWIYELLVVNYGKVSALDHTFLVSAATEYFSWIVIYSASCFYVTRIWILSRKQWWMAFIPAISSTVVFILAIYLVATIQKSGHFSTLYVDYYNLPFILYGLAVFTELSITLELTYFLRRYRSGVRSTNMTVNKILIELLNRGVLSLLTSTITIVLYVLKPRKLTFEIVYLPGIQLQVVACLSILLSRANKRQAGSNTIHTFSDVMSYCSGDSGHKSRNESVSSSTRNYGRIYHPDIGIHAVRSVTRLVKKFGPKADLDSERGHGHSVSIERAPVPSIPLPARGPFTRGTSPIPPGLILDPTRTTDVSHHYDPSGYRRSGEYSHGTCEEYYYAI
ncbi:hypothetical protein D9758_006250 [Tetrapyrgos nigripes]|uniref:Survival protein SurE-like phosphatase/nucleotidase domain-containing protein n=1 Tax=Tetrapyrgos nigripes TaxID=182062 RepID=A0A8H5LL89_9AGAR|nr:hypothetical protein D9758_006250 [Tetrapyrgos nigripes]